MTVTPPEQLREIFAALGPYWNPVTKMRSAKDRRNIITSLASNDLRDQIGKLGSLEDVILKIEKHLSDDRWGSDLVDHLMETVPSDERTEIGGFLSWLTDQCDHDAETWKNTIAAARDYTLWNKGLNGAGATRNPDLAVLTDAVWQYAQQQWEIAVAEEKDKTWGDQT